MEYVIVCCEPPWTRTEPDSTFTRRFFAAGSDPVICRDHLPFSRPDEQTHVVQENGRWSRQITGSLPAAKNLRVKVESGSVRVQGGSQQTITYSISNRSYASSEDKARDELEAYKISVYLRGDTACLVANGKAAARASSPATL